ncbi:MAG: galactokinase [Luteitalea sp.]|nr:galactokinase [Luteitalea sp.]
MPPSASPESRAKRAFARLFTSSSVRVARAPGRVNLIGEHTDYNDGFVLPMAIDRALWIAFHPIAEPVVRVYSDDFDEWCEFDVQQPAHGAPAWSEYIKGVAWVLRQQDLRLGGWEGALAGDVPIGAGLSSSAALELAAARVFASVSELPWHPVQMARAAQRAENEWVGMRCGIMDQLVAAAGRADHALLIDCRSLALTPVRLPAATAVVVLDTLTRRGLTRSPYNERRQQCEEAARVLGVSALRDVSVTALDDNHEPDGVARGALLGLDHRIRPRARHVVSENDRVQRAAAALGRGDAPTFGTLMNESHRSLRDDFEVSSPPLDAMVAAARDIGCYGARMTGAGFGGCVVALIDAETSAAFATRVAERYRAREGRSPDVYVCRATDGASEAP